MSRTILQIDPARPDFTGIARIRPVGFMLTYV